ncbi:MAG: methionyl-tRNA formyltransferase [Thermaerobacter sp.]|nr:methionyl-tRNA formyltransferase [Thermaerobacter sp.]
MRYVFMGTPAFAVAALQALAAADMPPAAVVTRPDRPRGRGMLLTGSPVKEWAGGRDLPVWQPDSLREESFLERVRRLDPQVVVTAAFGRLLPPVLLALPRQGCINLHASLLPRYRGAAPVQRILMAGEERTGVTTFWMDTGMDTGDIILQEEVAIRPEETAGELLERLGMLGGALLVRTLRLVEAGRAPRVAQDPTLAGAAPPIGREEEEIRWDLSARRIADLVRGLNPSPGARTRRGDALLKVWRASAVEAGSLGLPGTVLGADREGIRVAAGLGAVLLRQVQPAGGRSMGAADYALGHPFLPGERLG